MRIAGWLTGLLVMAGLGAGSVIAYAYKTFEAPGVMMKERVLFFRRGLGLGAIARLLKEEKVIREPWVFRMIVRMKGWQGSLRAGEYAFPAAVSMATAVEILRSGKPVQHKVTVPEGLTSREIVQLLNASPVLEGVLSDADIPPEGSLLPQTYLFERGRTRMELIHQMEARQQKILENLWKKRTENLPVRTRREALILASLVEKETGLARERPLVASVFINRLRKGMRLQSDPTIIYGITMGKGELGRPIRRSDIKARTPYNTYVIDGLPPAPICNPGEAAIAAVLNPPSSPYLYFVADGTGAHNFAKTLKAHESNVRKWRRIEKQEKRKRSR